MVRLFRFGIFLSCLVFVGSGYATTHYVAANGSDSNNGSKTTPWLHAPGMPNCSGNCASYSPAAGDQIIFRGGDTWHFGNSAASPYSGGSMNFTWGGAVGNPIYIGVDQSWFSGPSWVRPIFTGDNPTRTSAVSSCQYDGSNLTFVNLNNTNLTLDNIEFTGMCWTGSNQNAAYVGKCQCGNPVNIIVENTYMHGWTHTSYASGTSCASGQGITGDSHSDGGQGNQIVGAVVDGSDSEPTSFSPFLWDCYDVHQSVVRYAQNGVTCNNMHTFHDNLIEHLSECGDGVGHSNGFEFNSEWKGTNTVYNNVLRHNTTAVTAWVNPSQTDYQFNNVLYDNLQQAWDVDPTGGGTSMYFWNNTIAGPNVGTPGSWEGKLEGNVLINTSVLGSPSSNSNEINWTTAQAFNAGYLDANSSSANVIAPTSSNCNGVSPCAISAATNETSACSTVQALCSDTTEAVSYNSLNHTVSYPARTPNVRPSTGSWDAGAYLYTDPTGPNPPTGLAAIVH
jgi:hypothetical protein